MVPHGCFSCVVLGAGRRLTLLARRQFWDCRCSINDRCLAVERLALRWLSGKEPLLLLARRIQKLAGKRKSSGQLKRIAAMIDLSGANLVRGNVRLPLRSASRRFARLARERLRRRSDRPGTAVPHRGYASCRRGRG